MSNAENPSDFSNTTTIKLRELKGSYAPIESYHPGALDFATRQSLIEVHLKEYETRLSHGAKQIKTDLTIPLNDLPRIDNYVAATHAYTGHINMQILQAISNIEKTASPNAAQDVDYLLNNLKKTVSWKNFYVGFPQYLRSSLDQLERKKRKNDDKRAQRVSMIIRSTKSEERDTHASKLIIYESEAYKIEKQIQLYHDASDVLMRYMRPYILNQTE